jgi:hypothetical protein
MHALCKRTRSRPSEDAGARVLACAHVVYHSVAKYARIAIGHSHVQTAAWCLKLVRTAVDACCGRLTSLCTAHVLAHK